MSKQAANKIDRFDAEGEASIWNADRTEIVGTITREMDNTSPMMSPGDERVSRYIVELYGEDGTENSSKEFEVNGSFSSFLESWKVTDGFDNARKALSAARAWAKSPATEASAEQAPADKPAAPIYEGTLGMVKHQQTHPAGTQFESGGTTGEIQVDGMHKECPRCGRTATGMAAIDTYFGFRTMARKSGNLYSVPQPYCRQCRSSHAKEMRLRKKLAAELPADEAKAEAARLIAAELEQATKVYTVKITAAQSDRLDLLLPVSLCDLKVTTTRVHGTRKQYLAAAEFLCVDQATEYAMEAITAEMTDAQQAFAKNAVKRSVESLRTKFEAVGR